MKSEARFCWLACGVAWLLAGAVCSHVDAQEYSRLERPNENYEKVSTLSVTGTGVVQARPDMAKVRLGVTAQSDDASAAQQSVNVALRKTIHQIQQLGIPERALKTARVELSPVYAPKRPGGRETEEPRLVGYRASNTLEVEVEDLELVGTVIDTGVAEGVNQLEGIAFTLRDDLPFRTRALRLAAEEAQVQARALADALDVNLGPLRTANAGGVGVQTRQLRLAATAQQESFAPTPVEPGEIQINASITVHYEIESTGRSGVGRPTSR